MTQYADTRWKSDGTLLHVGTPVWLSGEPVQTLMAAFADAGFQIYAVGGCVRDTVMGRAIKDIDLSTDAHPHQTMAIIENLISNGAVWNAVPTGIEHGTVTAIAPFGAATFEVTTFRTDVETDGRHATVAFSTNIEEDALRRDFTINAFYADRRGNVRDIVGGSDDLKAGRIRFIGDPAARITEDYLRILRFFRFNATHGNPDLGIDADGLAACALLADGLAGISNERIGTEMIRLIMMGDPAPIIGIMDRCGVLHRILPGANALTLARLMDLGQHANMLHVPCDLATRLASLGCDEVVDRLRLSKTDARKIVLVLGEAGKATPPHELGYRYGHAAAFQCLLLRWASLLAPFDAGVLPEIERGASANLPISAADLMPDFMGKALGLRLKLLEDCWIASNFSMTRADLLAHP